MDRVVKILFQVQEFQLRADDDFVDRMNRRYTPSILCLFTVLVTMKQYVGNPIDCWCPAQFTTAHRDYTNTVCWVSDTYHVPFDVDLPKVEEPRKMISYYQWVPILLLSQAALFFVPYICWRFLNRRVGICLSSVVEAAQSCQKAVYPETRDKSLRFLIIQVDSYLIRQKRRQRGALGRITDTLSKYCCLCGKYNGSYLTVSYACVKVFYLMNIIIQLFLLDVFLGMEETYHLYGIRVLTNLFSGSDWNLSERFPRVTLCDFEIRQQTNVHRYTVQCVLPINLFNEKIFLFIWFWYLGLAICTLASFMYWASQLGIISLQTAYIKRQLKSVNTMTRKDTKTVRKFIENYLKRDGLFILRIVANNAGAIVAAEVLSGLWNKYGPEPGDIIEEIEHGRTLRKPTGLQHQVHDTVRFTICQWEFLVYEGCKVSSV